MSRLGRGPFGLGFRRALGIAVPATAVATLGALVGHALTEPTLDGGDAPGAASPWLTLPLAVAAAACALGAAHLWPTFSLRQPGADVVRRLERGPFAGRMAVVLGALLAQLLLTLPLTCGFARVLGAPAETRRHDAPTAPEDARLTADHATLRYPLHSAMRVEQVWLRPLAGLPEGPLEATAVTVLGDGEALGAVPARFAGGRDLVRLTFAPRTITTLELRREAGTVPLWFADGSVVLVGPAEGSALSDGLFAAAVALRASAVTLLVGALLGLGAGWPVVAAGIVVAWFVQWVGGVGPIDDVLLGLLRGVRPF